MSSIMSDQQLPSLMRLQLDLQRQISRLSLLRDAPISQETWQQHELAYLLSRAEGLLQSQDEEAMTLHIAWCQNWSATLGSLQSYH